MTRSIKTRLKMFAFPFSLLLALFVAAAFISQTYSWPDEMNAPFQTSSPPAARNFPSQTSSPPAGMNAPSQTYSWPAEFPVPPAQGPVWYSAVGTTAGPPVFADLIEGAMPVPVGGTGSVFSYGNTYQWRYTPTGAGMSSIYPGGIFYLAGNMSNRVLAAVWEAPAAGSVTVAHYSDGNKQDMEGQFTPGSQTAYLKIWVKSAADGQTTQAWPVAGESNGSGGTYSLTDQTDGAALPGSVSRTDFPSVTLQHISAGDRLYFTVSGSGTRPYWSMDVTLTGEPPILPGDLSGDGEADIVDLLVLQSYLLGGVQLSPAQETAADLDSNGQVTGDDLNLMKKLLLKRNTPVISASPQ